MSEYLADGGRWTAADRKILEINGLDEMFKRGKVLAITERAALTEEYDVEDSSTSAK